MSEHGDAAHQAKTLAEALPQAHDERKQGVHERTADRPSLVQERRFLWLLAATLVSTSPTFAAEPPAGKLPASAVADHKAGAADDAVAHYNRGVAHAKAGRHAEAVADYTAAIELNPKYVEAYYERANESLRSGEYANAVADCAKAIEHSPRLAEAYYLRGVAHALLRQTGKAQYDLHRAVELKSALEANVRTVAARFKLSPPALSASKDLAQDIQQAVAELDYSETVAREFAELVSDWELLVRRQRLLHATQEFNQGKTSKAQVAQIEEEVANQLIAKIHTEIGFGAEDYDLADTIAHRKANCLAYCQLLHVLGAALGLPVEAAYVSDGSAEVGAGYVAALVDLTDGTTMMVDLATTPVLVSKPFVLTEHFKKVGNYYELRTKDNPLNLYRRIQLLDRRGLLGALYAYRATLHSEAGLNNQAIADCTKAITLNPKLAVAYYNRGAIYSALARPTAAISDYTKAIGLNPQFAEAYFNRGVAEARLKKTAESIRDLRKAIELNGALIVPAKKVSDDFQLGLSFGGP